MTSAGRRKVRVPERGPRRGARSTSTPGFPEPPPPLFLVRAAFWYVYFDRAMNVRVSLVLALLLAGAPPGAARDGDDPEKTPVGLGLRWLLRAQNRDGSWGLDARQPGDVSCTAVAALALMAGGTTERGGRDAEAVEALRKAVEYVLKKVRKARGDFSRGEETLVQRKLGTHIHTFFSTVLLTQAFGQRGTWAPEDLDEFKDQIASLVRVIVGTQEPDGSWHKETFGNLKATCMAWLALRSSASIGVDVEKASVKKIMAFILEQYNPATGLFDKHNKAHGYQSIYATGSCLRVLHGMGEGGSRQARAAGEAFMAYVKTPQNGAAYLTVEGEDYLSAALVSQALLIEEDARWKAWFPWISKELEKRQDKDGSWTTTACISGRTFATACALIALQTPSRLLPLQDR